MGKYGKKNGFYRECGPLMLQHIAQVINSPMEKNQKTPLGPGL